MTTAALKGIDYEGGIDNYILGLDEKSVQVYSFPITLTDLWVGWVPRILIIFKRLEESLGLLNIYKEPLMRDQ